MGKDLVISSNRHETKVAILEDEQLVEIYFQRANEYSLVGSIHKGRVTRVLPGMQSAFVDVGLDRDAFLYVSDFFEETDEYEKLPAGEKTPSRETRGPRSAGTEKKEHRRDDGRGKERDEQATTRDGRRSRRSRRRRTRSGGFPDSKYAAEVAKERPAASEPVPEPSVEAADDEILLLPGESLAKYAEASEPEKEAPEAREDDDPILAEVLARSQDVDEDVEEEPEEPSPGGAPGEAAEESAGGNANGDKANADEERESAGLALVEPLDEDTAADSDSENREETEQEPDGDEVTAPEKSDDSDDDMEAEAVAEEDSGGADLALVEEPKRGGEPAEVESEDSDIQAMILGQIDDSVKEKLAEEARAEAKEESAKPESGGRAKNRDENGSAEVRERDSRYLQRNPRRGRRRGRGRPTERDDKRAEASGSGPDKGRAEASGSGPDKGRAEASGSGPDKGRAEASGNGSDKKRVPRGDRFPLPLISDLLKEGQEILVQIAKEPLGQKGARITSHIALPGRYVVFMPTLSHLGVSRKIGSDEERQRLRRILQEHSAGLSGGFIMRTAGEGKNEKDIAADMKFLSNLWADIRSSAEKRKAPALLHRDLRVVERVLRDQLADDFSTIWIDNEEVYEEVLRFMQRFQPALLKRVRMYTRKAPVFDAFNITQELEKALRPKVWLKSGGYIVINQTEALLAIDINTGKYVGRSNRLEDTIVKTNIEAVREIARQMRLRDLGGIIVVDFIDMEERKNRQKVMQALEEVMRHDRAPNKVLQFNDFGLVAITRKRVKQSLERTLCMPCPYCEGAAYVKSVDTIIGEILTEAYKFAAAVDGEDVMLRVHPDVAKVLKTSSNEYLEELEETLGCPVLLTADPLLHRENFDLA